MQHKLDKFFRDRIIDHHKAVPDGLAERIGQLSTRNKWRTTFWLSAAACAAFAAISVLYLSQPSSSDEIRITANIPQKIQEPTIDPTEAIRPSGIASDSSEETSKEILPRNTQPSNSKQITKVPTHEQPKTDLALTTIETTAEIAPVLSMEDTAQAEPVTQKQTRVTIVLSATSVNEKYLNKNIITDATEEPKTESSLRKVLDKAYELKNNQGLLGDLRQKKDEILALNFRQDKQKNERQ